MPGDVLAFLDLGPTSDGEVEASGLKGPRGNPGNDAPQHLSLPVTRKEALGMRFQGQGDCQAAELGPKKGPDSVRGWINKSQRLTSISKWSLACYLSQLT